MKLTKAILGMWFAAMLSANAASVLCVGLNDYDKYPDLKHAENDAQELGRMFQSKGHSVTVLTGTQVTIANFQKALEAKPDFVYFAGHAETGYLMVRDGKIELASIANPKMMMFLDCCYIGRGLKTSGTMKILAASEYEAFESGNHGLFTKHLLNWLGNGKAMSEEGAMTSYLTKEIRAETGGWQKPVLGFI